MSKIKNHTKWNISIGFEEDLKGLKGKIKADNTIGFDDKLDSIYSEDGVIFLYENEIIISFKDIDKLESFKKNLNKILFIAKSEGNLLKSLEIEVSTIHDSENNECIELFSTNSDEQEKGIFFNGYTLFMVYKDNKPCMVELSPLFTDNKCFYTKLTMKDKIKDDNFLDTVYEMNEYINNEFSQEMYEFIERRGNDVNDIK